MTYAVPVGLPAVNEKTLKVHFTHHRLMSDIVS